MDIEKEKPTPMTWTLIFRLIAGPLFLLCSIFLLSFGCITSAVFMFLAAVMALPSKKLIAEYEKSQQTRDEPTANMVMSKVNYSFSDTLQAVIVLVLVILSGVASPFWGLPWVLP